MRELYDVAKEGNLEHVRLLLEQGIDKNQVGGPWSGTALCGAALHGQMDVVRFLVEQGADMEKADNVGCTPLICASAKGCLEEARYLLEQGANRDKAAHNGNTPLHIAAGRGFLEITKLLMVHGADLNARGDDGQLPIDIALTEKIKQAIRNEPRRRIDEAPGKRATEQDRHPNAASTQEVDDDDYVNKRPRFDEVTEAAEGKVAEEDEPSDEEDDN